MPAAGDSPGELRRRLGAARDALAVVTAGLRARRRATPDGQERTWTVLGASRGEGGILGEGIRRALLRDPTYTPGAGGRRGVLPSESDDDAQPGRRRRRISRSAAAEIAARGDCSARLAGARAARGAAQLALSGGEDARRSLRLLAQASWSGVGCGLPTSAAWAPRTSRATTAWSPTRCSRPPRRGAPHGGRARAAEGAARLCPARCAEQAPREGQAAPPALDLIVLLGIGPGRARRPRCFPAPPALSAERARAVPRHADAPKPPPAARSR